LLQVSEFIFLKDWRCILSISQNRKKCYRDNRLTKRHKERIL